MTETRIRDVFSEAAEDITVGPPPELAGFIRARQSRRRLAVGSVGLVAAAAVGVVVAVTMVDGSPSGGPAESPSTPVQTTGKISLDCRTERRTASTWEGTGPYRRTPHALAKAFTNPVANEHAVLQSGDARRARALLLRGDGTAWATLDLRQDPDRGWYLYTAESCPGRYLRTYWQHQDHLFN